jgi:Flp pilus assembly protein TadG
MRLIRRLSSEAGQAVTEFAVILPLFFILLFAIVEGGIALNQYMTLTDAVRVAARTASVSASLGPAAAQTAAYQAMQNAAGGLTLQNPQVSSPTWASGDPVTASASVHYSIPFLGIVGDLTSTTTQRIE